MTTLRDEIHRIIVHDTIYHEEYGVTNYSDIADNILKEIEKRINSLPTRFEYHETEFAMGFAEACLKIKEIIKEK